jgi:hypothetical protein
MSKILEAIVDLGSIVHLYAIDHFDGPRPGIVTGLQDSGRVCVVAFGRPDSDDNRALWLFQSVPIVGIDTKARIFAVIPRPGPSEQASGSLAGTLSGSDGDGATTIEGHKAGSPNGSAAKQG